MEPKNLIKIIADTRALNDIRLNTIDENEFRGRLSRFSEQWKAVQTQLMVIAEEPLRALNEVQSELNKRLHALQLSAFLLRQLATTAIAPVKNHQ